MNIPIRGQVDRDLYVRAIRSVRPELRVVAVLVAVVAGLLLALSADGGSLEPSTVGLLVGVAFAGPALGFVAPALVAAQALRTGTSLRAPFSGEASPEGLSLESAYGSMSLPWSAFHRCVVRDDIIVVLQASNLMNMLDRSFVDSREHWEQLSQLVTENVPPRRRSRLVTATAVLVAVLAVLTLVLVAAT